jgi:hypothetical protein
VFCYSFFSSVPSILSKTIRRKGRCGCLMKMNTTIDVVPVVPDQMVDCCVLSGCVNCIRFAVFCASACREFCQLLSPLLIIFSVQIPRRPVCV